MSHSYYGSAIQDSLARNSAKGFTRLQSRNHLGYILIRRPDRGYLSKLFTDFWWNLFLCGWMTEGHCFLLVVDWMVPSGSRGIPWHLAFSIRSSLCGHLLLQGQWGKLRLAQHNFEKRKWYSITCAIQYNPIKGDKSHHLCHILLIRS